MLRYRYQSFLSSYVMFFRSFFALSSKERSSGIVVFLFMGASRRKMENL